MDLQETINNMIVARRDEAMKTSQQLMMGELILKLRAVAKELPVVFDDGEYMPMGFDSWRGSYRELAISYERNNGVSMTAGRLLARLEKAVGGTFQGYKGGDYTMGRNTPVWVANYGQSCGFKSEGDKLNQGVVDVHDDADCVRLITEAMEY